jgi:hypothetical protein
MVDSVGIDKTADRENEPLGKIPSRTQGKYLVRSRESPIPVGTMTKVVVAFTQLWKFSPCATIHGHEKPTFDHYEAFPVLLA